jgi:Ca2+-binding RTX toxin-like protein
MRSSFKSLFGSTNKCKSRNKDRKLRPQLEELGDRQLMSASIAQQWTYDANNTPQLTIVLTGTDNNDTITTGYDQSTGMIRCIVEDSNTFSKVQRDFAVGYLQNYRTQFAVYSFYGSDSIHLGTWYNTTVYAGEGNDTIFGGSGYDTLWGDGGNDYIVAGNGGSTIYGDNVYTVGNDTLIGGSASDAINGQYGNDVIYGLGGNDPLNGGPGADTIYGGEGTDYMFGGNGNDALYGEGGLDYLHGDSRGETGNDWLDGGHDFQNDILVGGPGLDIFVQYTLNEDRPQDFYYGPYWSDLVIYQ